MDQKGNIIRFHRLKKGYSQEYLAKGICGVSYLSKIENNQAQASEEILRAIFKKLAVDYQSNDYGRHLIEKYFKAYYVSIKEHVYRDEILNLKEFFLNSDLVISFQLFELYEIYNNKQYEIAKEHYLKLEKLKKAMNKEEKFLFYLMAIKLTEDTSKAEYFFEQAQAISNKSISYLVMANHYEVVGLFEQAIDCAQEGYLKANDEGLVLMMYYLSLSIANSHANLYNVALMYKYYQRCDNLAIDIEALQGLVDYNLGASLIAHKKYDQAKFHLLKALEKEADRIGKFYIYHKLAWISMETKDQEQTQFYIDKLRDNVDEELILEKLLFDIVVAYNEDSPVLQNKLEELIYGKNYHVGIAKFHVSYLMDIYIKKRKYKEAYHLSTNKSFLKFK